MAKKNARVVVSAVYFELIQRKAEFLDGMFSDSDLVIRESDFKAYDQINKAWNKAGADFIVGTEEPYVEPKAQKAKK